MSPGFAPHISLLSSFRQSALTGTSISGRMLLQQRGAASYKVLTFYITNQYITIELSVELTELLVIQHPGLPIDIVKFTIRSEETTQTRGL